MSRDDDDIEDGIGRRVLRHLENARRRSSVSRREWLVLSALFAVGFLSRLAPLLQFSRVGFDPFFHYRFSMALIEGKTQILVTTQLGEQITLYYPPLFHLLSLVFFLGFPSIDPYFIMKLIVSLLDSLQVFPIYYVAKAVSRSLAGATVAATLSMITPSDLHMISWGGYANVAGLLLITILVYLVIKVKAVAAGIAFTTLFLTHHLSMLFAVALFVPYFVLDWWQTRRLPKCFISLVASLGIAFVAFYWYALMRLFETYTKYAPRYAQFTLPPDWPMMFGLPLLLLAFAGIALWSYKTRLPTGDLQLLCVWFALPLLLGYAYLLGVQWHTVRWIYFLQQPSCIWAGLAVSKIQNRRLALVMLLIVLALQWIGTIQGYYSDISSNAGYTY